MKENNNTPLVWNNIPEWAIFALEYGIEEELFLTDEDKDLITRFIGENFPNIPCRWIGKHTESLMLTRPLGNHVKRMK